MRTNTEYHCTDFAHFAVQFPAMFRQIAREPARPDTRKGRKYGCFLSKAPNGSRLDLGRTVQAVPAPFLSQNQQLIELSDTTGKLALHGFCTLFAKNASPVPAHGGVA